MNRNKALKGRSEREKLEMKVYFALADLSTHFKVRDDPLQYEVNRLWGKLDILRNIPYFPEAQSAPSQGE